MSTQATLDTIIVDPDEVLFEGKSVKIVVPGIHQELAILPDHTPLYAQLARGDIVISMQNGDNQTISIESGVIRVKLNRVSIITGFSSQGEVIFE